MASHRSGSACDTFRKAHTRTRSACLKPRGRKTPVNRLQVKEVADGSSPKEIQLPVRKLVALLKGVGNPLRCASRLNHSSTL
eukprot:4634260-Prymnesium_polylepis.2